MREQVEKNVWNIAFWCTLFLILFVFFTQVHPLVPYDGDDWVNMSSFRVALPKWHAWNPVKVLPEISFPIAGYIAAYFVTPIVGDYVRSIVLVSAFYVCSIVLLYLFLFKKILEKNVGLSEFACALITVLFLIAHFVILKKTGVNSQYLLGSANLTCFYHYTVPGILNLCLVEYFMLNEFSLKSFTEKNMITKSIVLLGIYLAIFSNVLHSIIFIAAVMAYLILEYWKELLCPNCWKALIKENYFWLGIVLVWLVSLVFEMSGGRAHGIGRDLMQLPIKQTMLTFWGASKSFNSFLLAGIFILLVLFAYWLHKKRLTSEVVKIVRFQCLQLVVAIGILIIYLVLVCAKASPGYIGRGDVLVGPLGLLLIAIFLASSAIIKKHTKLVLVLPIALLVFSVEALSPKSAYAESTMNRVNPRICYAIDNDLINQIVSADKAGKTEMILVVPKGDDRDNWPHPMYMGGNISRTLYRHGIITQPLKITIKPDTKMNEKYHIAIPK